MLQLAGEIADGVIIGGGLTFREGISYALKNVEIGVKRAGRKMVISTWYYGVTPSLLMILMFLCKP